MIRPQTIVLAVGPTVLLARRALAERGIAPAAAGLGLRMVTRAPQLRGWSHGTPVAATEIRAWRGFGREAELLGLCLLAMLGSGRLRMLQDEDVAALLADAA